MRKVHKIMLTLLLAPLLFGCSGGVHETRDAAETPIADAVAAFGEPAPLRVVVTFDALYEIASAVGADRVSVSRIIPDGANAHHFEPAARDLAALNYADVFIKNGLGFEPWACGAIAAAGHNALLVVDASRGVEPIALTGSCGPCDHVIGGKDHHNRSHDPHAWISLVNAEIMAGNILDAFTDADPAGAGCYAKNHAEFVESLRALYDEFSEKFAALQNRTIVVSHAIFGYLSRDFGLTQSSIQGVFAEGEPNACALAELVGFSRENSVRAVLSEYLQSPLVAQTLAREIGAQVKTVYTIENREKGLSYLERMAHNLTVIYESLR